MKLGQKVKIDYRGSSELYLEDGEIHTIVANGQLRIQVINKNGVITDVPEWAEILFEDGTRYPPYK